VDSWRKKGPEITPSRAADKRFATARSLGLPILPGGLLNRRENSSTLVPQLQLPNAFFPAIPLPRPGVLGHRTQTHLHAMEWRRQGRSEMEFWNERELPADADRGPKVRLHRFDASGRRTPAE